MWGSPFSFHPAPRRAALGLVFSLLGTFVGEEVWSQVVLNEVMFDPSGSDYYDEFVELLNTSSDTVNLAGWQIGDDQELDGLVDAGQGLSLLPGQFALVLDPGYFQHSSTYDSLIPSEALVVTIDDGAFGSGGFSNSHPETVFLVSTAGDTVGAYRYSLGNAPGFSDEKLDPEGDDSADNWADARVFLGTPGFVNSVAQKAVDVALSLVGRDTMLVSERQRVHLSAVVRNLGKQAVRAAGVVLWWDRDADGTPGGAEIVERKTLPALSPGDSTSVEFDWSLPGVGLYLLRAQVETAGDGTLGDNSDSVLVAAPCKAGEVVINEIYYRPAAGEPEWIELYNVGPDSVSLAGWWLSDGTRRGTVQLRLDAARRLLAPGGYAVLAETHEFSGFVQLPPGCVLQPRNGFPSLNNTGDVVIIRDFAGTAVDSVRYWPSWGGENGISLERVRPKCSSTDRDNWRSSVATDGSTPGRKNSVSPPDRALDVRLSVRSLTCVALGEDVSITCVVRNTGLAPVVSSQLVLLVRHAEPCGSDSVVLGPLDVPALVPLDSFAVPVSWVSAKPGRWTALSWAVAVGVSAATDTARATLQVLFPSRTAVVNEIQFDPPPGEPEWVEVFNSGSQGASLDGWELGDSRRRVPLDSTGVCLEPGGYALLLPPGEMPPVDTPPGVAVWHTAGTWPGLSNGGDAVVLVDPCGSAVDSVFYRPTWVHGTGSLERILAGGPSTDSTNWETCQAPSGATPGRLNVATPRDVDLAVEAVKVDRTHVGVETGVSVWVRNVGLSGVSQATLAVTWLETGERVWTGSLGPLAPGDSVELSGEVQFDRPGWATLQVSLRCALDSRTANDTAQSRLYVSVPFGSVAFNELYVTPLPGEAEWVEVVNNSRWQVDLKGWTLQDQRGPRGAGTVLDSLALSPSSFAVFAADSSVWSTWGQGTSGARVTLDRWPGFNDAGDVVRLVDPGSAVVDSVRYSGFWPLESGYSLEKLRPELPSPAQASWVRSADPGGATPGQPNSVFAYTTPKEAALGVAPNPFSPDGDGHEDVAVFSLNFPCASVEARLRLFDVLGRRVRQLLANEPCGPHRLVVWDGRDDLGHLCRVGPYVALLEWHAANGQRGAERAVVVVAW